MPDPVDDILAQWGEQRPDLDVSAMGPVGRLSRVAEAIAARQKASFARHGLDAGTFDVLATLRRSPPPHRLTPLQLTEAAMISSAATSQRLNRLESSGLVRRTPRDDDGRGVRVELTDDGRRVIDQALPDHLDTNRQALSSLTGTQQRTLSQLLSRMIIDLQQQI
jgi:DNA-binding MarR family transcriptional regulator